MRTFICPILGQCALPVFVANGVTSVRDAGARLDDIATWQKQLAEGTLVASNGTLITPTLIADFGSSA